MRLAVTTRTLVHAPPQTYRQLVIALFVSFVAIFGADFVLDTSTDGDIEAKNLASPLRWLRALEWMPTTAGLQRHSGEPQHCCADGAPTSQAHAAALACPCW